MNKNKESSENDSDIEDLNDFSDEADNAVDFEEETIEKLKGAAANKQLYEKRRRLEDLIETRKRQKEQDYPFDE